MKGKYPSTFEQLGNIVRAFRASKTKSHFATRVVEGGKGVEGGGRNRRVKVF
jgi:hypothetical protein